MREIIYRQHQNLTPSKLCVLRQRIVAMRAARQGRISVATGCSGTDVLLKVLRDMTRHWQQLFGVSFQIDHLFSVDTGVLQQEWILAHERPRYLFGDLKDLAVSDVAKDLISGEQVDVPSPFMYAAGIECDTLSSLNRNRQVAHTVQQKRWGLSARNLWISRFGSGCVAHHGGGRATWIDRPSHTATHSTAGARCRMGGCPGTFGSRRVGLRSGTATSIAQVVSPFEGLSHHLGTTRGLSPTVAKQSV